MAIKNARKLNQSTNVKICKKTLTRPKGIGANIIVDKNLNVGENSL